MQIILMHPRQKQSTTFSTIIKPLPYKKGFKIVVTYVWLSKTIKRQPSDWKLWESSCKCNAHLMHIHQAKCCINGAIKTHLSTCNNTHSFHSHDQHRDPEAAQACLLSICFKPQISRPPLKRRKTNICEQTVSFGHLRYTQHMQQHFYH